ncbi:methyltransferase [Halalkalibaculum sp. DA384]|uniref:methyltransferase n=1 Tax=Halalkalibaculum sp. DA384 TaxID=3373606 RepID=UPI0037549F75
MPLRPNVIERQLIKWGLIPGLLLDGAIPTFLVSAILGAGEIQLFKTLRQEPAALEQLARKTGCNERALENLLNVLEPLGYVSKKNDTYSLTKYAKKSIPIDLFSGMVPFIKEQNLLNLQHVNRALKEAPEEGVIGWDSVKDGEIGRSYQVTMRWLARSTVEEVTKKIKLPKGSQKMLDIGGSHGLYCVEMCRKYPELKATVLDWPIGIENAKETLQQETDVADQIDTLEADFFEDEFPEGYDYAFLGNIIHGNRPEQNQALFNRLGEKLTDKGTIGILDQFDNVSGSQFTRATASLIGWNLFLFSNGRAYEVNEVKGWLKRAGFPNSMVKPLRKSPGFTLLVATK